MVLLDEPFSLQRRSHLHHNYIVCCLLDDWEKKKLEATFISHFALIKELQQCQVRRHYLKSSIILAVSVKIFGWNIDNVCICTSDLYIQYGQLTVLTPVLIFSFFHTVQPGKSNTSVIRRQDSLDHKNDLDSEGLARWVEGRLCSYRVHIRPNRFSRFLVYVLV